MKTLSTNIVAIVLALAILFATGVYLIKPAFPVLGAGAPGTAVFQQIATTTTLSNPGVTQIFVANDSCKSRVVTTIGTGLWLAFASTSPSGVLSSTTLTVNNGHYQATNTTQVYDSGLYGCQGWIATSTAVGSKVITSEF